MASVNPDYPLNQPTGNIYLDSLIWGGSWSDGLGGTTHVSWSASVGQLYEEQPDVVGDGWLNFELNALKNALKTWSNVANITFTQVPTYAQSNIQYYNISNSHMQKIYDAGFGQVLGFHDVPDSAGTEPLYGVLNHDGVGWTKLGLQVGGMGFNTLVHEIGHGLGLAHPHDDGGGSSVFPGVNSPFASYGTHDLNQGVFTIMSYNDGWIKQPSPLIDVSYGLAATPMAFDIAAIQLIYGANMHYNTGNNLYFLPKFNGSGAYWSCIWDAGGKDTISANGTHGNATINLNAAPLVGENAGGYISHVDGIVGGFTIANNVVIENAIGGNGHDQIIGNQADNYLVGGKGNDVLNGGAGTDKMSGGFGNDIYFVDQLLDRVVEPSRLAGEADEVRASITYTLGAYLEHLTLIGNGNHNGTGNNASNILKGDGTNNALYGRAANDTLEGGGGSDTLDGGSGADRLTGGQGDDVYYIDHKNDLVIEATNQGVDLIRTTISYNLTLNPNVENLILLGKSNLNATGNSLDN
ncbi:MAG: matrixin family metalloprotease, partial [Methylotenera sp.]|nr:matrixin family metalloprotease [Methylotenera sp.]